MPMLIEGKRLKVHKEFLTKFKAVIGKTHEPFFVLMLRAAEAFVTPLVQDDRRYWYGMTEVEVNALSEAEITQLYEALLTYYSVTLTGDKLPGTLKERVQLTVIVNGDPRFGEELNRRIPPHISGGNLFILQNNFMAEIVARILKANNPDFEQIKQTLLYTAIELVGKPAAELENRKCFVATAAFNGESHLTVIKLRALRDNVLAANKHGQRVVGFYEHVGPGAASLLDSLPIFKPTVRLALTLLACIAYRGRWGRNSLAHKESNHPGYRGGTNS